MKFIVVYNEYRNVGRNPSEAFGLTASLIAIDGTMKDLQVTKEHFLDDVVNVFNQDYARFENEMEELNNEKNTVVKSKVS